MIKKDYESYIILDGNFEDSQIEEIILRYENLLKKNDVEIKNIERIGRRRMAYPIKKKQNGYYICYEFVSAPETIEKIERAYKLDENILRYLTVYMSKKTLEMRNEHFKKRAIAQAKMEAEKEKIEEESKFKEIEITPEIEDIEIEDNETEAE